MKLLLSLVLIFFTGQSVVSQDDFMIVGFTHSPRIYVFPAVNTTSCLYAQEKSIEIVTDSVAIVGDSACQDGRRRWYIIAHEGKPYFIEKSFFRDTKSTDEFVKLFVRYFPDLHSRVAMATRQWQKIQDQGTSRQKDQRIQDSIAAAAIIREERQILDSLNKEWDKLMGEMRSKNRFLYTWSWSYSNSYSKFADVNVTVLNPYRKKIKYVWFTFRAFNAVDDPVRDGYSKAIEKTVKGIGPIEYSSKASYTFESIFYSGVIDYFKMTRIKIQFLDGTVMNIANPVQMHKSDVDEYDYDQ